MLNFRYTRPESLDAALADIRANDDGKLLGGGMTLIPALKHRLTSVSNLIDLAGIAALRGISIESHGVVLGAMTTHAAVACSSEVRRAIPALASLAAGIGDAQVRHRGTLGGSIANNDPAADYPAACIGLGATIVTDRRKITADDFFADLFETALARDEIVTAVRFDIPKRAVYMKFANPASRYAMVGVFVAETSSGPRVAVTGAGRNGVFRVPQMEKRLSVDFSPSALRDVTVAPEGLLSDLHCDSSYRAHLITVMAQRAVAATRGEIARYPVRHGGALQSVRG